MEQKNPLSNATRRAKPETRRITVVNRKISELKLDPRNPRIHRPKQIRQIAWSIEAFGFIVPVLVDATLKVMAGHGRILACGLLGWSEVPTICLEHLSEAQARAFKIADCTSSEPFGQVRTGIKRESGPSELKL